MEREPNQTEEEADALVEAAAQSWVGDLKDLVRLSEGALKRSLVEYFEESAHSGWEGYTAKEVVGIYHFLSDLRLAVDNGLGAPGPLSNLDIKYGLERFAPTQD